MEVEDWNLKRIPSSSALEILKNVNPDEVDILGLDGFLKLKNGKLQAIIDLTLDLSNLKQLSSAERLMLATEFVKNRSKDELYFEIVAQKIELR